MIDPDKSIIEQFEEEAITLGHKYHALGISALVGWSSYDPRLDKTSFSYTSSGDFTSCLGISVYLKRLMDRHVDNAITENEDEEPDAE